jgi:hypothetical protein
LLGSTTTQQRLNDGSSNMRSPHAPVSILFVLLISYTTLVCATRTQPQQLLQSQQQTLQATSQVPSADSSSLSGAGVGAADSGAGASASLASVAVTAKVYGYDQEERRNSRFNRLCCPKMTLYSALKLRFNGKKNRAKCETLSNYALDSTGQAQVVRMNECFGAVGDGCNGVPGQGLLKLLRPSQFPLCAEKDETTMVCYVNIGSIRHDLCCLKYADGAFCNDWNYPILSWGRGDGSCACKREMATAITSLARGYGWYAEFPKKPLTIDELQPVSLQQTRKPILAKSLREYEDTAEVRDITENTATIKLVAPAGTPLACPNTDPACMIDCTEGDLANKICNRGGKDTVTKFFEKGIVAGHSMFCASGKFTLITHDGKRRFGVCSNPSGTGTDAHYNDEKANFMKGYCDENSAKVSENCGSNNPFKAIKCNIARRRLTKHCAFLQAENMPKPQPTPQSCPLPLSDEDEERVATQAQSNPAVAQEAMAQAQVDVDSDNGCMPEV